MGQVRFSKMDGSSMSLIFARLASHPWSPSTSLSRSNTHQFLGAKDCTAIDAIDAMGLVFIWDFRWSRALQHELPGFCGPKVALSI